MLQLVVIVIIGIVLWDWFINKTVNKQQARRNRIDVAKKSENDIEEINKMIEDTKAEISNCARTENMKELEEYKELLELLLRERRNIRNGTIQSGTTKNLAKKLGKVSKDIKSGIQEGWRE